MMMMMMMMMKTKKAQSQEFKTQKMNLPDRLTPRRKPSYTVVTSGYCWLIISDVSAILRAPPVP